MNDGSVTIYCPRCGGKETMAVVVDSVKVMRIKDDLCWLTPDVHTLQREHNCHPQAPQDVTSVMPRIP